MEKRWQIIAAFFIFLTENFWYICYFFVHLHRQNNNVMSVNLLLFIAISFTNVFLHIFRTLLVVKSGKLIASLMNCICYTFSAVVVKFISESDLLVAMIVAASTNFFGCYVAMLVFEKIKK